MNRLLLFLAFVLLSQFSFGQIQSNCTDNSALIAVAYKYDIHYLTVNSIPYTHSDYTIDVPKHRTDGITKAITAIFNTGNKLKADSVFDKYCVHERFAKNNSIEVVLDSNASWQDNWENGISETGNATLDNLLKKYGYTVIDRHGFTELVSDQLINRFALSDSLQKFVGVRSASPMGLIRNGITYESIYYGIINNMTTVGFIMPWTEGDYNTHHWRYTIDENCMVSIIIDTVYYLFLDPDRPYPTPKNCNISANNFQRELNLYPNPSNGNIIINTTEGGTIRITNLTGQILKQFIIEKGYTPIDISSLAQGMYLIDLRNENGRLSKKILKE